MTQLQTETITYSKTHLVISEELSFEEWQQAVETFARLGDCWQWWLGDLLKFGQGKWGEMYAQALDSTEMKYQTLANLKWVANAFDPHRRREGVSWSHHAEIAGIDSKEKQDQLLKLCETKGLSRKKLRQHLAQDSEGMLGEVTNGENKATEELSPAGGRISTDGGEAAGPLPHIDLTDRATKRNFDKTIEALDQLLRLRIPNMFLRGTAFEDGVVELRQMLLEAAK